MSIFRENFLNEGFFNKKKKKETLLFTNEEYDKFKEYTTKKLKEIVSKYNRDPQIKKEMRKRLDNEIQNSKVEGMSDFELSKEFDGFNKNNRVPILLSEIEEQGKAEIIYLIYDGSQTVNSYIVVYIIEKIIKELKEDSFLKDKYNYINYGEGDEGCIYILFR